MAEIPQDVHRMLGLAAAQSHVAKAADLCDKFGYAHMGDGIEKYADLLGEEINRLAAHVFDGTSG